MNERASLRVDDDRSDFAAVLLSAHVEVADRRLADCAPGLGLLVHTLDDFACQITAVELGDGTHDAVQQNAAWRLIDVLRAGDQRGTASLDLHGDDDIVCAVAREAIDLVNDDKRHRVLTNVLKHACQFRSVGGLCALASVGELLDHGSFKGLGFAQTSGPLRGDREAFGLASHLCLLPRRHPQVDHSASKRLFLAGRLLAVGSSGCLPFRHRSPPFMRSFDVTVSSFSTSTRSKPRFLAMRPT